MLLVDLEKQRKKKMSNKEQREKVFKKYDDVLSKDLKDFSDKDWKRQDKFIEEIKAINALNEE